MCSQHEASIPVSELQPYTRYRSPASSPTKISLPAAEMFTAKRSPRFRVIAVPIARLLVHENLNVGISCCWLRRRRATCHWWDRCPVNLDAPEDCCISRRISARAASRAAIRFLSVDATDAFPTRSHLYASAAEQRVLRVH